MTEMIENSKNNDSDSSDDLPDIFGNYNGPCRASEVLSGDIVWAKWSKDQKYWPAIIRRVDKKKRRVRVWFTDTPNMCFYIAFKDIHDFRDQDFKKKVEDEMANTPDKAYHAKQVDKAFTHQFKKAFGIAEDPASYFDENKQYFCFEKQKNELNLGESSKCQVDEVKSINGSFDSDNQETDRNSSSETDEETDHSPKKRLNIFDEIDDSLPPEKADAVVSCIKSGYVNNHLTDISLKKIACKRQLVYEEAMEVNNKRLLWDNLSKVYIKEHKKNSLILSYLTTLYEELKIKSFGGNTLQYCTYVWLPEAIEKAAELVDAEPNLPMATDLSPCKVPKLYNIKRNWFSSESDPLKDEEETIRRASDSVSNQSSSSKLRKNNYMQTRKSSRKKTVKKSVASKKKQQKSVKKSVASKKKNQSET